MLLTAILALQIFPACPVEGSVTSPYGFRTHPVTGQRKFHHGLDIAAPRGTPIRSVAAGTVVHVGAGGSLGNNVTVQSGRFTVRYAHADEVLVELGQAVAAAQVIARVGQTGRATGPHVHLTVRRRRRTTDPDGMMVRCSAQ